MHRGRRAPKNAYSGRQAKPTPVLICSNTISSWSQRTQCGSPALAFLTPPRFRRGLRRSHDMANYTNTADTATTEDVVEVLNDLLENSRDGEYVFRACA